MGCTFDVGMGGFGSRVCVNYSSPLEMQTTAEAREPPRYVGHFLSRTAAVLEERERGFIEVRQPADESPIRGVRNHRRQEALGDAEDEFFFAGFSQRSEHLCEETPAAELLK